MLLNWSDVYKETVECGWASASEYDRFEKYGERIFGVLCERV